MSKIRNAIFVISGIAIFFVFFVQYVSNRPIRPEIDNQTKEKKNFEKNEFEDLSKKLMSVFQRYDFLDPKKRYLAHISTDKKIYRSGDPIYVRAVLLNAFNHSPLSKNDSINLENLFSTYGQPVFTLINSKDQEEVKFNVLMENSVISFKWNIPKNQAGGTYKIKISFPTYDHGKFFVDSAHAREIEIQNYVPKRYKKSIEFLKRGYVENDEVNAIVSFERSEGGYPDMDRAKFHAIALVDGLVIYENGELSCNEDGKLDISFNLPSSIDVGEGSLTVIIIEGMTESVSKSIPITLKKLDVKLYPEGGDFVESLENGCYIEVKDYKDDPVDFEAQLITENQKVIVERIESKFEGRGYFSFKHEKGVEYYVNIISPVKQLVRFPSESKKSGVTLLTTEKRAFTKDEDVVVMVSSTEEQSLFVGLFKKEKYLDLQKEKFDENEMKMISLSSGDSDGVLRITVFNENFVPLAERVVFIVPKEQLDLQVQPDKEEYVPGEKVTIKIKGYSMIEKDKIQIGVTVTDDTTYQMSDRRERHPTLFSQVFLESEIDENEQLFDSDGYHSIVDGDVNDTPPDVRLDLLMGIQGWRRFLYKNYATENANNKMKRLFCVNRMVDDVNDDGWDEDNYATACDHVETENVIIGQTKGKKKRERYVFIPDPMPNMNVKCETVIEYERVFAMGPKTSDIKTRSNFFDTLFYSSYLEMDKKGEKIIEFYLNDNVGTFRIFIDGYSAHGLIGSSKSLVIKSVRPFFIEPKVPLEITNRDIIHIPILIANNLNEKLYIDMSTDVIGGLHDDKFALSFTPNSLSDIELGAHERKSVQMTVKVIDFSRSDLTIKFFSKAKLKSGIVILEDSTVRKLNIVSSAFPLHRDYSGVLKPNTKLSMRFIMPQSYEDKTLMTMTKVYSTPASSLSEGLKSLIKKPYGCFEQTSNTMYPLIMAKQYFSTHKDERQQAEESSSSILSDETINEYLEDGYKKLLSFECKEKGAFEWFGHSPGHEALTALGVMEFFDLASIHRPWPSSSPIENPMSVIDRAMSWLLSRFDGDSISLSSKKFDSFGYAPKYITEAYIIWALSVPNVAYYYVERVMEKLIKDSDGVRKDDSYYLGLVALSLYNYGKISEAKSYVERIVQFQDAQSGRIMKSTTSVTKSQGVNLEVETTSIGVLNFLNFYEDFPEQARLGMQYILSNNKNGRFGSTQATVLALKAIVEFDEKNKVPKRDGIVRMTVNGNVVSEKKVIADNVDPLYMDDFSNDLVLNGIGSVNNIELEMIEGCEMPFSMQIMMNTEDVSQLSDIKEEKLEFDVMISNDREVIKEGESIEINVNMKYLKNEVSGMAVTIISIPAGLEVDFDYLKELKRGKVFDYFELFGTSEVVIYWKGLAKKEEKKFNVRCDALVPGLFYGKPSQAYLYYEDDNVYFSDMYSFEIVPN